MNLAQPVCECENQGGQTAGRRTGFPTAAFFSARVPPASGRVSLVSVPQPVTVPRSLRRVLVSYSVGSLRGTLPGDLMLRTRWHPHILVLKHHPDDASHSSQSLQWPPRPVGYVPTWKPSLSTVLRNSASSGDRGKAEGWPARHRAARELAE